jgi:SAM-dependent methyltransferase
VGKMGRELTKRKYWDDNYVNFTSKFRVNLGILSKLSFYNYDLLKRIKKYIPKKGKAIEIGCAPGNNIINISEKFKLRPFGVEYSPEGVRLTRTNFRKKGFNPEDVIEADFFSKSFQNEFKDKFELVCSFGFIEHFDNPEIVVEKHAKLLKKGGVLFITVPNLSRFNKRLTETEIVKKHNLNVMSIRSLKSAVPKSMEIKQIAYFGGFFNIGLFFYKNRTLELIRLILFILQRLIADPIFFLLDAVGLDLNNKYSSPGIMLIAVKK